MGDKKGEFGCATTTSTLALTLHECGGTAEEEYQKTLSTLSYEEEEEVEAWGSSVV